MILGEDRLKNKLVFGVGINDADYKVTIREEAPKVNGKRKQKIIWKCPFYYRWCAVLDRCFNPISLTKQPTYIGCSVCEEWLTFSNFKSWMEQQEWEGKDLDKDLLVYKNKIYSPETCVFIPEEINSFLTKRQNHRGNYPLGVRDHYRDKKFYARISDSITGKMTHLGSFITPEEAHKAWQKAKIKKAQDLAVGQTDEKIVQGLLRVADKIQYDLDNNLITEDF